MTDKILYRYERTPGEITISPDKPQKGTNYTTLHRLIAGEGKALTLDDVELFIVIDVESVDGWHEVDAPEMDE